MRDSSSTWKDVVTLPNVVTLCRLALAPLIFRALAVGHPREALALFALAAATDGVDGYLARRFGWRSQAGAYLDPIADKILLSGIFLTLAYVGQVSWWFVALVFGRDLFILAGAATLFSARGQRKFPPSVWGKLSTFLQVAAAIAFLTGAAAPWPGVGAVSSGILWASAAATLWSGLDYGWRGVLKLLDH